MDVKKYRFYNALTNLTFVDAIWLYGSRARGDQQARSDIDIAILCPSATDEEWQKVLKIVEDADTLLEIDCVRFDTLTEDSRLRENILQERQVLFERTGEKI